MPCRNKKDEKLKLPKFPGLKLRKRKKLRATTARRPLRIAATANYDEMAEPNMKLSRALLIVLLLHVVAVSGIVAFNAIKTRQGPPGEECRNVLPPRQNQRGRFGRKKRRPRGRRRQENQRRESPAAVAGDGGNGKENDRKTEHGKKAGAGPRHRFRKNLRCG